MPLSPLVPLGEKISGGCVKQLMGVPRIVGAGVSRHGVVCLAQPEGLSNHNRELLTSPSHATGFRQRARWSGASVRVADRRWRPRRSNGQHVPDLAGSEDGECAILLADAFCHSAARGSGLFRGLPGRGAADHPADWTKRSVAGGDVSASCRRALWLAARRLSAAPGFILG